jgi:HK97 family phage prohead protease
MTMERRALTRAPELREGKTAKGYAALFNSETDIGGYFRETIAPGAFAATLKDSDVRALVDHDSGRVIGRSSAGTLRLSEDDTGLAVEIDLPDTSDGRDLAVLMERGDISGMSFGFRVTKEQWDETVDPPTRTILAAELFEVSAVAFPAYEDTTIALRSLEAVKEEARQRAADNAKRAVDRIAARKAKMEQQFRGINAA